MQNHDDIMGKKGLILIIVVFIAVLILGFILLVLGFNESFSSDSKSVHAIFSVVTTLGERIVFIVVVGIFYIAYNKRSNSIYLLKFTSKGYNSRPQARIQF